MTTRAPRRAFLALAALLVLAVGAVPPGRRAIAAPSTPRVERVVVVVFGGGVRTKELIGRHDLCPTIRDIGKTGFSSEGWVAGGVDPVDGTESILTGRSVAVKTPSRTRPVYPTLMEYARKGLRLPATAVWYASFADGEALELATSDHKDYGPAFEPAIAAGSGPFSDAMKGLFTLFGRPNPTTPRTWELIDGLRAASTREAERRLGADVPGAGAGAAAVEARRLERALLEEVDRRAVVYSGPAGLDTRAMRAGITALRVFRPTLLVIRLGQADVASKDLYAYWDVLRRDDAEIARLRAEIAADPALRSTTTLLVVADVGRDAEQNAAGGYDRSDGSADATTVALVGEGPGLRAGAVPRAPRSVRDLCPTIGRLLGFSTPFAEGVVRDDVLATR